MTDERGQRSEVRGQRSDDRSQVTRLRSTSYAAASRRQRSDQTFDL
ncbi:hypothetical protein D1AOALGA4SA_5090 [Olavius algarvensis Delta 1 endosymbiont]|nr:hypothetical protein D1AOALGA4SA_5090 [Olavius algarvensis Delta 1 endosymbiont]